MTTKLFVLAFTGLLPLLTLAACGGEGKKFPETLVLKQDDIQPVLANSELVSGKNRFAFGLFDPDSVPIVDAKVHLAFYYLGADKEAFMFEIDAVSRVPARDAGIEEKVTHIHTDRTAHDHFNVGEQLGVYTAVVDFPVPGEWGVELKIDTGKLKQTLRPRFRVSDQATTVPIGHDAPRTKNLTVNDVADISTIDTSVSPSSDMHTSTIAGAIAGGRPVLILFAAPGYCTSQLCGPEFEIMRKLFPRYKDRVEFIHVEAYKNPTSANRDLVDAAKEWGLQSEPWFFVVGKDGKVSMKFEGPTSLQELEEALQDVLK